MAATGFEQFAAGQVYTSASRPIDTEAIKAFAAEFDFQPQHTDEGLAQHTMFGSLVASGWHTAALTMRLMLESVLSGVAGRALGAGIREMSWAAPVYPGDELHAVSEIVDARPSRSKPDRGVLIVRTLTRNQRGAVVQDMTGTLIVLRSDAVVGGPLTPPRDPARALPAGGAAAPG